MKLGKTQYNGFILIQTGKIKAKFSINLSRLVIFIMNNMVKLDKNLQN